MQSEILQPLWGLGLREIRWLFVDNPLLVTSMTPRAKSRRSPWACARCLPKLINICLEQKKMDISTPRFQQDTKLTGSSGLVVGLS